MRFRFAAAAALIAAETAAIACVCVGPLSAGQQREAARRIATEASAVAEIELVEPMDHAAMRPELYRVVKLHVGQAPKQFRLAREFTRSADGQVEMLMTSCDVVPPPGERTLVVLHASQAAGSYIIGGTCEHLFINSPGAIDLVREEARALAGSEERG